MPGMRPADRLFQIVLQLGRGRVVTAAHLAEKLEPEGFLRIHRSIILNNRYLDGYQYLGNNEYAFRMKNGNKLMSSRSYKQAIQNYFLLNV